MSEKETNFIESVNERDIDLLILEELHVSPAFQAWFVKKAFGGGDEPIRFDNARHSLSHLELGESDIVFTFYSSDEEKRAILIENKIRAGPQPKQGVRYGQRGEEGIEAGYWQKYNTCILAPQSYLRAHATDVKPYGAHISYESLQDWFQKDNTARSQYKSRLLQKALTPPPGSDPQVTQFWYSYWIHASSEFPELAMKRPGNKAAGAGWIDFVPKELGKRFITHKLEEGCVDLQIAKASNSNSVETLKSSYGSSLGPDAEIVKAGGSVVVRLRLKFVDRFGECDAQIDNVRAGLRAAFRLLYMSRVIKGE